MPRSNRRQGRSSGRQNNPQSYEGRSGGFEETGTGYRYDDERRRFGQQSRGSGGGRNWPGPESDYGQQSRFGRGSFEGSSPGQGSWSSEYPGSYRGSEGRSWRQNDRDWDDESRYGRRSEEYGFGSEDYGDEGSYAGYEPSEYTSRGSGFGSRQRFGGPRGWTGQGQAFGEDRSVGQDWRGSSGMGSRQFGQGQMRQSGYGQFRGGTSQGSFIGRGPQGYKRSDERISEDINEMLTQDEHIDAVNITVEVQNGEVTLRGTVPDREAKRRAEDLAESTSGVKDVQNQLRVKREDESETETKREKGDDKQQRSHRQQIAS